MKILHAADLHIDSPMGTLDAYEGAPVDQMRSSTRRAVDRIVDLAVDEHVDVVTIGGDVFDGQWRDINTGLWWNRRLDRLVSEGIEVFVVHGNHDAESVLTQRIPPPDGVHVFPSDGPVSIESTKGPLVVHGQSYGDRAVNDDLAAGYPTAVPGVVNVGVLHTSLEGHSDHATYAPTTLTTLGAKGYALWALGHVHERAHTPIGNAHVLFPGNPQGRSVREVGPRSVSLVTTDGTRVVDVTAVEVDVVRWAHLRIDIQGCTTEDDLVQRAFEAIAAERAQSGRPMAVRVTLHGTGPLHRVLMERHPAIRATLIARLSSTEADVWLEKLVDATRPERQVGAAETAAVVAVRKLLEDALQDEALARTLVGDLPKVQDTVGGILGRLRTSGGPASVTSSEFIRARLERAADRLVARLEER
jgi:DNA repair protein SbcD/Mre11